MPKQIYPDRTDAMQKSLSEPASYSSPGLEELLQRLKEGATCDILELGPVRSRNVEFWSRFSTSLYIADLRSCLPLPATAVAAAEDAAAAAAEDVEAAPEPDWKRLLDLPEGRSYDAILAWDLLNYLDLASISSLIRYLKPFCRPGTILFTLIFDQKQMPEKITVYRIIDESHLAYEYGSLALRPCLGHQPRALAGVMSPFITSSSFRLRNGVVEYLFIYEGETPGSAAVPAA